MLRAAIALLAVLLFACSPQAGSSPSPTSRPASPSPTGPAPTGPAVAGVLSSERVDLPSQAVIEAPSRDLVWASVGGILLFRSEDRGGRWEQRPLPPSALDLESYSFIDDREGWVGYCDGEAAHPLELWHTTDGGDTYERLAGQGLPEDRRGPLSFVRPELGFISQSRQGGLPAVYRTTDGGATWQRSGDLPLPPGVALTTGSTVTARGVEAFGSTLLFAARADGERPVTIVYRSDDDGASWNAASTVEARSLALVSEMRWLQISAPDRSLETTDGGASWHAFAIDYQQAAPVPPDVTFADQDVGYATVRGSIQRTMDGGSTWTTLETPGTR